MINVTRSFLPPKEIFDNYTQRIWESRWLTNRGQLALELEQKLATYLGLEKLLFVNNGTIAIQIAIKALDLKGEILTTPFSYVATTSSIVWENCRPVFVDINESNFTIDAAQIERHISPRTSAILATHVYGYPCDVEAIETIAKRHGLKVIYDAAHCFGVKFKGKSLFSYGDISTTSFHATKLFHSGEGGGIVCDDQDVYNKCYYMHNFGHNGEEAFSGLGINGKNSEFHAAMGLSVLPFVDRIIQRRKEISDLYDALLPLESLKRPEVAAELEYNYAYYPVVFESEQALVKVRKALNDKDIFPRRYFFPSLSKLPYVSESEVPVANEIAPRVLCLPLYYELTNEEVAQIAKIINEHI